MSATLLRASVMFGAAERLAMATGCVASRDGAFPALDLPAAEAVAVAVTARRHPVCDPAAAEALGRALLSAYDGA